MSLRMILIGGCAGTAALALGAASYVFAAENPDGGHVSMVRQVDPAVWHKQMCEDYYARDVGRIAYIETRLSLTDVQHPLFDSWRQAVLGSAKMREGDCLSHQSHSGDMHPHGILERQARMQAFLQGRLADMNGEAPSLTALYNSLSPEQKLVLDDAGREGHDGMHGPGGWHHHGDMHGPGPGPGPEEHAAD